MPLGVAVVREGHFLEIMAQKWYLLVANGGVGFVLFTDEREEMDSIDVTVEKAARRHRGTCSRDAKMLADKILRLIVTPGKVRLKLYTAYAELSRCALTERDAELRDVVVRCLRAHERFVQSHADIRTFEKALLAA